MKLPDGVTVYIGRGKYKGEIDDKLLDDKVKKSLESLPDRPKAKTKKTDPKDSPK